MAGAVTGHDLAVARTGLAEASVHASTCTEPGIHVGDACQIKASVAGTMEGLIDTTQCVEVVRIVERDGEKARALVRDIAGVTTVVLVAHLSR